ncbi:hypothetical protein WICPIJ_007892, partial [Wickerhamomyces pijperi]
SLEGLKRGIPKDCLDEQMGLGAVADYAGYYRFRRRIDVQISKSLLRIVSSADPEAQDKEMVDILKWGGLGIPILYITRSKAINYTDTLTGTNKFQLSMRYHAHKLLGQLISERHVHHLSNIEANYSLSNTEQMFFDMAKTHDPASLSLIPIRTARIQEIVTRVLSNPHYHYSKPSTFKISLIVHAFNEVVDPIYVKHEEFQFGNCRENFSVLRIYAGEIPGDSLLKLSIIQHIGSLMFGIESQLSESFLIIKDASFKSGHSYLSITSHSATESNPGYKIYTYNYLLDRVTRSGYTRPLEALRMMTEPLSLQECHGAVQRGIDRFQPLAQKRNIARSSGEYWILYPYSKIEFSTHLSYAEEKEQIVTQFQQCMPDDAVVLFPIGQLIVDTNRWTYSVYLGQIPPEGKTVAFPTTYSRILGKAGNVHDKVFKLFVESTIQLGMVFDSFKMTRQHGAIFTLTEEFKRLNPVHVNYMGN